VVVEDRRAPGERELGEPGAGRGVLHLVIDARPCGVERLEPGEEVGLLRAGARQRLVQVVVGVDQARRDHRAAEILCRCFKIARRVARADVGDQAVLDLDPAALVLGARVVHRHDPPVAIGR